MTLIKDDLKKLGIQHDNFFSETELVKKDLVNKTVKKLQTKNFVQKKVILILLKVKYQKIGKK